MDILSVDKTDTITMNQLAVTGIIPLDQSTESDALFARALAPPEANQDPIDPAFLPAARVRHIFGAVPAVTGVSFKPFDPQSRQKILKATNDNALYTFNSQTPFYLAVFSIVSAREPRWLWATMASKTLVAALTLDALAGIGPTVVGLPGLRPLPSWQTLTAMAYTMVACLVVNDAVKIAMIKWRVPMAGAEKPLDCAPQIAKRACEL